MPATLYPQLHDPEFLANTRHLSAAQLAEQVGCQPQTVDWYRKLYQVLRNPNWSEVEVEILTHFYGRSPVACIAAGVRRPRQGVYNCAHRLGLKGGGAPRATDNTRAHFWTGWQAHILENMTRWVQEGLAEQALELLWRPPTRYLGCQDCAHLPECQGNTRKPVRCERLTVREYLQYFHTEEIG
jgi:hypothetical protein